MLKLARILFVGSAAALPLCLATAPAQAAPAASVDKLVAHNDPARSGWNPHETRLTPSNVASGAMSQLWSSPQLDSFEGTPPRLFSAPLYMRSIRMNGGKYRGKTFSAAFVTTTTGYAYAISTAASGAVPAGTILWSARLTETPCNKGTLGNYGTGVIDAKSNRFYVTSCSNATTDPGSNMWSAHALDIRSGQQLSGWPVALSQTMIDQPSLNRNGTRTWKMGREYRYVQRGALVMSPDSKRLYLAFGADAVGWMLVLDVDARKVVSAFSSTPDDVQDGGGMWAQGGPSVDKEGRLYVSTGSNLQDGIRLGLASMHWDKENSWSHSILQFEDDRVNGLKLTGTYTPYNYCQAGKADIDIGSSPVIVLDLPAGTSKTPRLATLGGGKQGNIYLLDRDNMPGGLTKRQPCSLDPSTDLSLLSPEIQPEWKTRGPINLFKPFSDEYGAYDQAKSRTSASYYRDEAGATWIYVSGASKTGEFFNTSAPPGLARVAVVTSPDAPAHLKVDKLETTTTFKNAGSPVISSNGGKDAIVWMVDQNAARTVNIFGAGATQPILYAFDAVTLKTIWKTEPGVLHPTGNYSEPTVADGLVLVGTDRLQAFGVQGK